VLTEEKSTGPLLFRFQGEKPKQTNKTHKDNNKLLASTIILSQVLWMIVP